MIEELKRYEPYTRGTMIDYGCEEYQHGSYVRYEDYEKLEKQLHDLEDAINYLSYECSRGDMYYTFENVTKIEDDSHSPEYHKTIQTAIKNSKARR